MSLAPKRLLSGVVLSLVAVTGSVAAMTVSAQAAPAQGGSTLKTAPTSTTPGTQVRGEHTTRYCVSHYKPGSTVKVVNKRTGSVTYIHTNSKGSGCGSVSVEPGACQTIAASGSGADSSSSSVCVLGENISRGSGTLPFTGSDAIVPGSLAGVGLILLGGFLTFFARRRRAGVPA